jgi:hypothetical protein
LNEVELSRKGSRFVVGIKIGDLDLRSPSDFAAGGLIIIIFGIFVPAGLPEMLSFGLSSTMVLIFGAGLLRELRDD